MSGYSSTQERMIPPKPGSSLRSLQHELQDCVESDVEFDSIKAIGPNHTWSLHKHTILKSFGITIHGAIDTFSKMVIWMDVCLSHRSDECMLAAYVNHIEHLGVMPEALRLDNDQKHSSVAMAHHELGNDARRSRGEEDLYDKQVVFNQNRPLEHYWGQQTKQPLRQSLEHFDYMEEFGHYYRKSIIDRIAFLAVYIPILRMVLREYASLYNAHRVSKQKDKPSYIPSQRYEIPSLSGSEHRGLGVSSAALKPWKDQIDLFDRNEYLPKRTREWCEQCLAANGIHNMPETGLRHMPEEDEKKHETAYSCLQDALHVYMIRIDELKLEDLYDHESSESLATAKTMPDEDDHASAWIKDYAKHREIWNHRKQPFVLPRAAE